MCVVQAFMAVYVITRRRKKKELHNQYRVRAINLIIILHYVNTVI